MEREPGQYIWHGYRQLFELVRSVGLKMQVVLSFHACGGNVGDTAQIPLPRWVLEVRRSSSRTTSISISISRKQRGIRSGSDICPYRHTACQPYGAALPRVIVSWREAGWLCLF